MAGVYAPDGSLNVNLVGATTSPGGGSIIGGGSTPSSSLTVQRATGTTKAVASAATPSARRTIRNTGTVALEFGPSSVTFGTGHPLSVGESFTFDDNGRYTGDIYVVSSGDAAWATSTVSF